MVDAFRFVVVIVALVAASQIPGIITHRVRTAEAWIVVGALEILVLSRLAGTLAHLGEPIRWYGSPALFVACLLILWYVWRVHLRLGPVVEEEPDGTRVIPGGHGWQKPVAPPDDASRPSGPPRH